MKNDYSDFQKEWYTKETPFMQGNNHLFHNENPDYWNILLGPIKEDPQKWQGKNALDFACGCGRNLLNLSKLAKWATVDGADISAPNCGESEAYMWREAPDVNVKTYETSGYDLANVPSDKYDFVMSTIALQHICVHEIRFNIMKDIHRVMKQGGMFSFQMGYGETTNCEWVVGFADYFENAYHARNTNSGYDVKITNKEDLIGDLEKIGFEVVEVKITPSFSNPQHKEWIWIKAIKK